MTRLQATILLALTTLMVILHFVAGAHAERYTTVPPIGFSSGPPPSGNFLLIDNSGSGILLIDNSGNRLKIQ